MVKKIYAVPAPTANAKAILIVAMLFTIPGWASADALLDALEAEAEKVEPTGGTGEGGILDSDEVARESFEEMLDTRYHGSYIFYEKLPDRMQIEIYQDYVSGVGINELRSKIINRYLQQN